MLDDVPLLSLISFYFRVAAQEVEGGRAFFLKHPSFYISIVHIVKIKVTRGAKIMILSIVFCSLKKTRYGEIFFRKKHNRNVILYQTVSGLKCVVLISLEAEIIVSRGSKDCKRINLYCDIYVRCVSLVIGAHQYVATN